MLGDVAIGRTGPRTIGHALTAVAIVASVFSVNAVVGGCSSSQATGGGHDGGDATAADEASGGGSGSSGGSGSGSGSGSGGTGSDAASDAGSPDCSLALGTYSGSSWPPACVPFYASTSFFDTPIPANPAIASNSSTIVGYYASSYNGFQGMGTINVGDPNSSGVYGHPIYFGRATDPLFTLHCLNGALWGMCSIEGAQVHIPDGAQPAGGTDGHLGVIDQTNGNEYDMWQAQRVAVDGGQLDCTYGGMSPFVGPGFTVGAGDATAAHANLAAGLIRSEEIIAGEIDHVLFGTVACCNGQTVGASKTYGGICDTVCTGNQGGALGQVYMLDMTDAEIEALGKSPAGTAILKAMAHYGIVDGDENAWGFLLNAVTPSFSRTSVGGVDPIVAWAQAQGLPSDGSGGYTIDYGSGIDWATKLVALAPP
jgi:hypothetical protein